MWVYPYWYRFHSVILVLSPSRKGCNNAWKGKVKKYTSCFYLCVISSAFKLSIWNVKIVRTLSYIYRIPSDFEFEQKYKFYWMLKEHPFFFINLYVLVTILLFMIYHRILSKCVDWNCKRKQKVALLHKKINLAIISWLWFCSQIELPSSLVLVVVNIIPSFCFFYSLFAFFFFYYSSFRMALSVLQHRHSRRYSSWYTGYMRCWSMGCVGWWLGKALVNVS